MINPEIALSATCIWFRLKRMTNIQHATEKPKHDKKVDVETSEEHSDKSKSTAKTGTIFTCPMHLEVKSDKPGSCPKCGMTLISQKPDNASDEDAYKKMLKKFRIALVFTVPLFDCHVGSYSHTTS